MSGAAESIGRSNFKRLVLEAKSRTRLDVLDEEIGDSKEQQNGEAITAPPPTEVKSKARAEKADAIIIPVRRVLPNDIPDIGPWLLPRLSSIWVNVSDAVWASKIRAWMMMNDAAFCRTDNVVGLAIAQRDDMDGLLRVRERFVLGRYLHERLEDNKLGPIERELLAIYRYFRDWSRSKNAIRINVLEHSDMLPGRFEQYTNNVINKVETYIRLVKQ